MKEFLDNVYKQCASSKEDGVDCLFQVIPTLLNEKKFSIIDSILKNMDLSRVHTSTMFSTVHLVCDYVDQLSEYKSFYTKCREEYARRGEKSERIAKLFDQYQNGGDPKRKYDPNAPPYVSPDMRDEQKLDDKIAWASQIGDQELVDYLTYYKAGKQRSQDRDRTYRQMAHTMGDEELRKRTIKSLREMADLLEESSGSWPGIYYCNLPENPLMNKTFIDGIEVIISYPWPG